MSCSADRADFVRVVLLLDRGIGYCRDVLEGVQQYAAERPNWVLFDAPAARASLAPLKEWRPHGVIAHLFDASFAAELVTLGLPTVNTTSTLIDCPLPLIEVDHEAVGAMAAQFFADRGYRRYGFFGSSWTHFSRAREAGFRRALHRRGFDCQSCYEEFLPRRFEHESWRFVQEKTERWLISMADRKSPAAIFAANDLPARYLTNHCRTLGLRIPQDVAVLSVDNDRFECHLASPHLSSIEIPSVEIGRRSAQLLDRLMQGRKPPKKPLWLPPLRIVVRGSTDAVAVADDEVRRFFAWLETGYMQELGVDAICRHVGVGRRTLERKLQSQLGVSVAGAVRARRLREVQRLLLETREPIAAVAAATGFSSPERLAKVVRATLGVSPSEFRRQGGRAESNA
jgi:LacI family transcriptional regulator